jgi:hypothetical protein
LVRRILNAHSRIHCGPEIKFFRDFYGDYPNDVLKHLRFVTTARAVLPEPDLLELLGRAFVELHERAAERSNKCRWADKNPENVLYLAEWQRLLGNEWVLLHVARNPLDTLASIKESVFPLSIPSALDARVDLYCRYNETALNWGRVFPERYYCLVYEALVGDPHACLGSLMRWLRETFEQGQLVFNRVPHGAGLEDPKVAHTTEIHAASLQRWTTMLTAEEARFIWRRTHGLWARIDPQLRHVTLSHGVDVEGV